MEKEITEGNNPRLKIVAVAFVHYNNKFENLNKIEYPILRKETENFKRNINSIEIKKYIFKINNNFYVKANKKQIQIRKILLKKIKKYIKDNNINFYFCKNW